jgi:uncharacterized protein (TIGR02246 family)
MPPQWDKEVLMATRTKAAGIVNADEATLRSFPHAMIAAWNRGDAAAFAAPFADNATFIAFEGTKLEGRNAIVEFHQPLFDTHLKGTRLEGDVEFVRFLEPDVAVMHARCGVMLAGHDRRIASRESMQLFVCTRHEREWRVDAIMNARRLTLEQQLFADDLESLPASEQRAVKDRVTGLARADRRS